jgi:hypothetical protein
LEGDKCINEAKFVPYCVLRDGKAALFKVSINAVGMLKLLVFKVKNMLISVSKANS